MKAKFLFLALSCLLTAVNGATVDGELRKWHKVTLGFTGPVTGEAATPNPFTDYRLDVTFTHAGSGSMPCKLPPPRNANTPALR